MLFFTQNRVLYSLGTKSAYGTVYMWLNSEGKKNNADYQGDIPTTILQGQYILEDMEFKDISILFTAVFDRNSNLSSFGVQEKTIIANDEFRLTWIRGKSFMQFKAFQN